jgi:hypothetical protein
MAAEVLAPGFDTASASINISDENNFSESLLD